MKAEQLRLLSARVSRRFRTAAARLRFRLGAAARDPGPVKFATGFGHPVRAALEGLSPADYRQRFPEAHETELRASQELLAHRFELLGQAVEFGPAIDWNRDPISGRCWGVGFSPDIRYRGEGRLGDIKFPWELNKHQYFFTLGKAAWLTGESSPAREIVAEIDDWIAKNPFRAGINWISALEVGARATAWILAYPFFERHCDEAFRRRFLASLFRHMLFVEEHLSVGRHANTHLVGEAATLVLGGVFLDCPRSAQWIGKGLRILEGEMQRQVTDDFVHAERSVSYQRFFVDHYYLAAVFLSSNRQSLSEAALRRLEAMTGFLMDMLFPDGSAAAFGDGDSARGIWLGASAAEDYRGLLALGAVLFDRSDFKAVAGDLSEEVFWLGGPAAVRRFDELPAQPPEHASIAYERGGYFVMRSGWAPEDAVAIFDCGPLGHGPSAHGHADALSFQLSSAGYSFLVDAGTYSYNLDPAWRDAFRSTAAHNTVVVDEQSQSEPGGRMAWQSMAKTRASAWISTPGFDLVDGQHDGYLRLAEGVVHRRAMAFLKPDVWIVADCVHGTGRHRVDSWLHLRPDCGGQADRQNCRAVLTSPAGGNLYAGVHCRGVDDGRLEMVTGDEEQRSAWFSPGYGIRIPSRALRLRGSFEGSCELVTLLSRRAGMQLAVEDAGDKIRCFRVADGEGADCRFWYVGDGKLVSESLGIEFHGAALLRRTDAAGRCESISAASFRELTVKGLFTVRTRQELASFHWTRDRCEITTIGDRPDDVHVEMREPVTWFVDGRRAAAPA